jgi:hypothetical protein
MRLVGEKSPLRSRPPATRTNAKFWDYSPRSDQTLQACLMSCQFGGIAFPFRRGFFWQRLPIFCSVLVRLWRKIVSKSGSLYKNLNQPNLGQAAGGDSRGWLCRARLSESGEEAFPVVQHCQSCREIHSLHKRAACTAASSTHHSCPNRMLRA